MIASGLDIVRVPVAESPPRTKDRGPRAKGDPPASRARVPVTTWQRLHASPITGECLRGLVVMLAATSKR